MESRLEQVLRAGEAHRRSARTGALEVSDFNDDTLQMILEAMGKGGVKGSCAAASRWCALNNRHRSMCEQGGDAMWTELTTSIFGANAPVINDSGSAQKNFYALCAREYTSRMRLKELLDRLGAYHDALVASDQWRPPHGYDEWLVALQEVGDLFAWLARNGPRYATKTAHSQRLAAQLFVLFTKWTMRLVRLDSYADHNQITPGNPVPDWDAFQSEMGPVTGAFRHALEPAMVVAHHTEGQATVHKVTREMVSAFFEARVKPAFEHSGREFHWLEVGDGLEVFLFDVDDHASAGGNEWIEARED